MPGTIAKTPQGALRLSAEVTGSVWNSEMVEQGQKFDWLSLPKKFEYLENKFGLERPELSGDVLSINAARNCLAHRGGVVGRQDVRGVTDDGLVVSWRKIQIRVRGVNGERVIAEPARVEKGELVMMELSQTSRSFKLGQKIELSVSDYVGIATTLTVFGLQLDDSINKIQQKRYNEQEATKSPPSH
jgi:hypothetical protein